MPTVSWILEAAIDRYWERGGDGASVVEPVLFDCPFCDARFRSSGQRDEHVSITHPIERPVMFLRGQDLPARSVIRAKLRPGDLRFTNCESVSVRRDGGPARSLTAEKFAQEISRLDRGYLEVALENRRVGDDANSVARYAIRIAVADPSALSAVDELFITYLGVDGVNMAAVRHFADACERFPSALEYANALADYVMGTLIKDGDHDAGATLPFATYKEKLQAALAILSDYPRAVARTVCACIRFNLNDFRRAYPPSGVHALDDAIEYLTAFARGLEPPARPDRVTTGTARAVCPIDRVSSDILSLLPAIFAGRATDRTKLVEIEARLRSGLLSEYDRTKLQIVLADSYLRAGDHDGAMPMLRALAYNSIFGGWASARLKEITTP